MPTPTYDLIASNTLNSNTASVSFTSITGSYRDLIVIMNVELADSNVHPDIRFNSDTGSNYFYQVVGTNGSTYGAEGYASDTRGYMDPRNQSQIGQRVAGRIQIFDYAQTNKHKAFLSDSTQPSRGFAIAAQRWASTSAVTSITLSAGNGNFVTGSSFFLYGIVA